MRRAVQLELFPAKPRVRPEHRKILRILKTAAEPRVHGFTRAQIKRLMTPLPRITIPR